MSARCQVVLGVVLALASTLSCATRRATPLPRAAELREIARHWEANERVLLRILEGKRFDESYETAVEFFEETTGIAATDRQTFVGRLPSQTLAEDLKKWRAWYEQHKDSLYWDSDSSRIRVRGVDGVRTD